MLTFIKSSKIVVVATLALTAAVLLIGWITVSNVAEAQITEPTYPFSLAKKLSDPYPTALKADQFKFHIEGTSATGTTIDREVSLTNFTDDFADTTVDLPIGTYKVTEIGPASFIPGEWTVQWSGRGCENANSPALSTIMTVSDDVSGNICRADNQWRPGKLTVEKIIIGTSTSPADFYFIVTQGSAVRYDGPFDAVDGINEIIIAKGDYVVTENDHPDYTTIYSDSCNGTIAQGGSVTCTITNTYNGENGGGGDNGTTGVLVVQKVIAGTTTVPFSNFSFNYTGVSGTTTFDVSGINNLTVATGTYSVTETPATDYVTTYNNCTDVVVGVNATSTCIITNTLKTNDNGGGGNDGDDYRLQGYVWHDKDEDGEWDEDEDPLADWTVHLTGNDSSQSTITDQNGLYFFIVDEGSWTLSETVKTDWTQTHPTPTTYVVTVLEEQLTLRFPLNYLFSIAHAETIIANGDFNFGNVFKGGQGGNSGGGGGATRTNRNNDGGSSTPTPTPLVLGEQVSPMPMGAPDTGAGGTYPASTLFTPLLLAAIIFAITLIRNSKLAQ